MSVDTDAPEANGEHVAVAAGSTPGSPPTAGSGGASAGGTTVAGTPTLPVVDLPGASVAHDATYRQIRALFTAAEPLTFFASEDGGRLVEPGALGIEAVTPVRFATAVQRHMRFRRRAQRTSSYAELPDLTARRMVHHPPSGQWPVLRGVARHPVLLPGGRLVTTPGYDRQAGWYVDWRGPPIRTAAASPSVVRRTWELLLDFDFADDASRWYAMALFVQPFVRPAIPGPTPLYLVGAAGRADDGEVEGSNTGKTYLAQLAGFAALGRQPPMMKLSDWGSEGERQLVGVVAREPEMILLDNLSTGTVLGGGLLHQLLTAYESTFVRNVGEPVREVPVRMMWVASGNGIGLDGEQARRTIPVRLQPRDLAARPYRTRDLLERLRRPGLRRVVASVICRMIEDWLAAGCPRPPRTLSSFGGWSDVVGGIVCHHGGAAASEAWLTPSSRPVSAEAEEWSRLFAAWPTGSDGAARKPLPAAAVVALLGEITAPGLQARIGRSRNPRARSTAMGRALQAQVDRPRGGWVLRTGTSRGKTRWYRPDPLPGGTGGTDDSPGPPPETPVISIPGGTGGTGGTCNSPHVSEFVPRACSRRGVEGSPSGPSGPPTGVIPKGCGGGPRIGPVPPVPPPLRGPRWRDELEAMQRRGVRVDPERWGAAVAALREGGIAATLEAEDPAQAEAALHRLVTLDSYAEAVQAQASLDPDQRVRATWYAGGTWSGRITARQPPLQSITKQGELRAAVVPAPGCSFVVGDWSQSQLRIAFGLSGDPAGPRVCAPGQDLHAQIGEAVAPGHSEARALGKLLNFAVLYLAGADTLVAGAAERGIELTRSTATGLIRRLEAAYPVLCAWRRAQAGLLELPVTWDGKLRRTVPLPSSAFDATGTPSLPKILAGTMQAHEVEALRFVLDHTEQRLGALGYRPVLLVHDEVVWEGPTSEADEARVAAHALMVEALAGVTRGIPALATVDVRRSWAPNG